MFIGSFVDPAGSAGRNAAAGNSNRALSSRSETDVNPGSQSGVSGQCPDCTGSTGFASAKRISPMPAAPPGPHPQRAGASNCSADRANTAAARSVLRWLPGNSAATSAAAVAKPADDEQE